MGRQGPPAHPRALDLQDPARLRPPGDLQRQARRLVGEPRADDPPLQGGRRAAVHARRLGARGAVDGRRQRRRLPRLPAPRRPGDARARPAGDRAAGRGGAHDRPPRSHRPLPRRRGRRARSSASRPPAARPRASAAPGWRSAPRTTIGTIGGGQLEYMAIDAARAMLARGQDAPDARHPARPRDRPVLRRPHPALGRPPRRRRLGARCAPSPRPSAGRCPRCTSSAPATSAARWPRRWRSAGARRCSSTSRAEELRLASPGVDALLTPLPEEVVRHAAPGRRLRRPDPRPRARLPDRPRGAGARRRRLRRHDRLEDQAGVVPALARARRRSRPPDTGPLVCPIGAAGRPDKRPEVIAAFVAAEIMQQHRNLAGANARRPTGTPTMTDTHRAAAARGACSTASSSSARTAPTCAPRSSPGSPPS